MLSPLRQDTSKSPGSATRNAKRQLDWPRLDCACTAAGDTAQENRHNPPRQRTDHLEEKPFEGPVSAPSRGLDVHAESREGTRRICSTTAQTRPAFDRCVLGVRHRPSEAYLRAPCGRGGIGRHARFRIWCRKVWGFEPLRPHKSLSTTQRHGDHSGNH